jgi:clan AA aspartic protease
MSAFTVHATLKNPAEREWSTAVDFLVDTGAIYTTLPTEIVAPMALATPYERTVEFANGQRDVWRMGEVRIKLSNEERTTVFLAGPPGCRPLLGAVTLEEFGVAVDPIHQCLVPIPSLFV